MSKPYSAFLLVDDQLPAGNIVVDNVHGNRVCVHQELRDTTGDWFYWKFRIRNATGRCVEVEFTQTPVVGTAGPAVSFDHGQSWRWLGCGTVRDNRSFCLDVPAGADEVWLCMGIPYLEANLASWLETHRGEVALEADTLCHSRKGRPVRRLRVGCLDREPECRVILTARHHCCEMMASYVLEGMLDSMLAQDATGRWFRANVETAVIPFVDTDGAEDGDQGKNRAPRDHNRDYAGESIYPECAAIRRWLPAWAGNRLQVEMDLHCPYIRGQHNENIYQVGSANPNVWREQCRFGQTLQRVQEGRLHYRAENDLPFGESWNKAANYSAGMSFTQWVSNTIPGLRLATSVEIPYASNFQETVTPSNARILGSDFARALKLYLETS